VVPFLVREGNSERKNISSSGAGALSAIDESTTDTMVLCTFSHRAPPEQSSSASLRQRRTSGAGRDNRDRDANAESLARGKSLFVKRL
jgi:hypothetical protein